MILRHQLVVNIELRNGSVVYVAMCNLRFQMQTALRNRIEL